MNRQAKSLQAKAKKNKVRMTGNGEFMVTSSTSGNTYRVREVAGGFVCCCKWASYRDTRKHPCTHVLAVEEWLENAANRRLSFWANEQDAQRQHRPTRSVGVGLLATSRVSR